MSPSALVPSCLQLRGKESGRALAHGLVVMESGSRWVEYRQVAVVVDKPPPPHHADTRLRLMGCMQIIGYMLNMVLCMSCTA